MRVFLLVAAVFLSARFALMANSESVTRTFAGAGMSSAEAEVATALDARAATVAETDSILFDFSNRGLFLIFR